MLSGRLGWCWQGDQKGAVVQLVVACMAVLGSNPRHAWERLVETSFSPLNVGHCVSLMAHMRT